MRRWMILSFFLITTLFVAGMLEQAMGYDTSTHEIVNEVIFNISSITGYFDNVLQVPVAKKAFQWLPAVRLMKDGGRFEDKPPLSWNIGTWPYVRSINHFHDPTKPWEAAGLTTPSGLSNILWAQYGRLADPPYISAAPNDRTWDNAVQYFRAGLTDNNYATRDLNLANLFSALGHLTHLVADVSVPEHTRNDIHVLPCIEDWIKANLTDIDNQIGGLPVYRYDFPPDPGIFAQSQAQGFFVSGPLSPISNLWDSNPDKTGPGNNYNKSALQGGRRVEGLAEYSNFNYFSDDTVFRGFAYPAHPAGGVVLWTIDSTPYYLNGALDNVPYYTGMTSDGIPIDHLAAVGMLYKDWENLSVADQLAVPAHLDENCYKDYASSLLPRAVSYGTALVNYFFRGKFDASTAPDGRSLRVTNQSSGSAHGQVTVYQDAADGTRTAVWNSAVTDWAAQGQYGSILDFPFPSVAGGEYLLVFEGDLQVPGSDAMDYAVAGKAFTWTAPQTTFPVAWRPVPTRPVPDPVPNHRSHGYNSSPGEPSYSRYPVPAYMAPIISLPYPASTISPRVGQPVNVVCDYCHSMNSLYVVARYSLRSDMTSLELCKNCHGRNASADNWPNWATNNSETSSLPRILVSPDAVDPSWKDPSVTTFNPHDGNTVSGIVQFIPALFDYGMLWGAETHGPFYYRVEVWTSDGSQLVTSFPGGNFNAYMSGGWQKATGFVFLRDWTDITGTHEEKLLWDSRTVPSGTYRFRFYPMRDPVQYPGPKIGNPAQMLLTVRN